MSTNYESIYTPKSSCIGDKSTANVNFLNFYLSLHKIPTQVTITQHHAYTGCPEKNCTMFHI